MRSLLLPFARAKMVKLSESWTNSLAPKGLFLSALLSVGSGLDSWARRAVVQNHVSFAAVNAFGLTGCAVILWVLRSMGVVWFRAPSQTTAAALLPSAAALVLAVLAAQQAIRYGNVVVHSLAQHLVPLFATVLDFLATGSAPHSGKLCLALSRSLSRSLSLARARALSLSFSLARSLARSRSLSHARTHTHKTHTHTHTHKTHILSRSLALSCSRSLAHTCYALRRAHWKPPHSGRRHRYAL